MKRGNEPKTKRARVSRRVDTSSILVIVADHGSRAVLHASLPDPRGNGQKRCAEAHQDGEGETATSDSVLYCGVSRRRHRIHTRQTPWLTGTPVVRSYNLPALQSYLAARPASYRTHPRIFDTDCLHTPYLPPPTSGSSFRSPALKPVQAPAHVPEADLLNLNDDSTPTSEHTKPVSSPRKEPKRRPGFSTKPGERERSRSGSAANSSGSGSATGNGNGRHDDDGVDSDDDWEEEEWVPDVFLFEYGTVVIWGMTEKEERAFLRSL